MISRSVAELQREVAQTKRLIPLRQPVIRRNLLVGIAAVSLLVGGIGIMNIMLVSVNGADAGDRDPQAVGAPSNTCSINS